MHETEEGYDGESGEAAELRHGAVVISGNFYQFISFQP